MNMAKHKHNNIQGKLTHSYQNKTCKKYKHKSRPKKTP